MEYLKRISKTTWLAIFIGIFIIVTAGLGLVNSQSLTERRELQEKLDLIQQRLSGIELQELSRRQEELKNELTQVTSQLDIATDILRQPAGSVTVTKTVYDIAKAYDLQVTLMTSSSPVIQNLEGVTLSLITVTARVEGETSKLTGFITKLNRYLTSGVVKSISLTISDEDGTGTAIADIHLDAYTYEGK